MPRYFLAASASLVALAFILVLFRPEKRPAVHPTVSARTLQTPAQFPITDTGSSASNAMQSQAALRGRVASNYDKLSLRFEPNRGQTNPKVKFLSRNALYTLFLSNSEAVFSFADPATTAKPTGTARAPIVAKLTNPAASKGFCAAYDTPRRPTRPPGS
jgi:hypothetical protein